MYALTWDGTLAACSAMASSLLTKGTYGEAEAMVARAVSRFALDRTSHADVMDTCRAVLRALLPLTKRGGLERNTPEHLAFCKAMSSQVEPVMRSFNRAVRRQYGERRREETVFSMSQLRGRAVPIVFYLVSKHQKPQKAHAELQGKLLVDRYWKSALENAGIDPSSVGRFIKANGIPTVQWAMGEPHYLITRPNCRHFLIPVSTGDAMGMGLKALNAKAQRRPSFVRRPITDEQRHVAFMQLRGEVYRRASKAGRR